jgi:hypothetical protein
MSQIHNLYKVYKYVPNEPTECSNSIVAATINEKMLDAPIQPENLATSSLLKGASI